MLTLDAKLRRAIILRESHDHPEATQALERALWRDVLQAIADGTAEDPRGLARAALGTEKDEFPRLYP